MSVVVFVLRVESVSTLSTRKTLLSRSLSNLLASNPLPRKKQKKEKKVGKGKILIWLYGLLCFPSTQNVNFMETWELGKITSTNDRIVLFLAYVFHF